MSTTQTYYKVAEIVELLQLSKPDQVLGWINSGQLPAVNIAQRNGRRPRWRVQREAFEQFLATRGNHPTPKVERRRRPSKSSSPVTKYF